MQYTSLTDEELLRAYKADGDNKWLGILLQRYTTLLLGVAMKYLKDKTQAEDTVQQVFLKALTHLPKEEILNFKGWLYVLVRNQCLQTLRNKTHKISEAALINLPAMEIDKGAGIVGGYTADQVEQALNQLNDEQKKAIELFYLKKHSYEQIIAETGYTFMQVKSYIQNGKRNLKNILEKTSGKSK